jgi:hypothetical protein
MVDPVSVRGRGVAHPAGNGSAASANSGVGAFVNNVVTLAELQADLAALNLKEAARKAVVPIGLIVVSLALLAAGVTVALFGLAWLLATWLRIHQGWAMMLMGGVAIAVAGPVIIFGVARLISSFDSFRTSREELKRNLVWLRHVLISRSHLHRGRTT